MDIQYFTDSDGCVVHVGYVMGWNEPFWNDGNEQKYYALVGLPDLGNMLRVVEIAGYSWNEKDGYLVRRLRGSVPFEVETWKMGAI